ncbi:hypothetical protein D3C87_792660 [compost metagenome]
MALSKKDWIQRCRDRFITVGCLLEWHAQELAEWCWVNRLKGQKPEDAAEEDMKHWDV